MLQHWQCRTNQILANCDDDYLPLRPGFVLAATHSSSYGSKPVRRRTNKDKKPQRAFVTLKFTRPKQIILNKKQAAKLYNEV